MLLETGKIREYARATAATATPYFAETRAPIPPTFLSSVVFWEDLSEVFRSPAARAAFESVGIEPDVRRLLSLEQEYEFLGAYPRAGEELSTRVHFDSAEVKEGSSGTMLLLHFAVDFATPGGEVVVVARYTSAYLSAASERRGSSGRDATREQAGEPLPERTFGPVTMTDIVRYQGASGDFNPMHHDDELARSAGYPAAFSVGMLGAGYLATYCVDIFGVESIARLRTRFRGLVFRGEPLTVRGRSTSEHRLELTLQNDRGTVVIEAEVDLR